MKRRKIRACVMALAMAACLTPLGPAIAAPNQGSSAKQPAAAQKQNKPKTYFGKIVKLQNGKYGLIIDAKKSQGYFLDDQKTAAKYAGKDVLVKGKVDPHTSILHVASIKAAF
jgi:hypothetical protein